MRLGIAHRRPPDRTRVAPNTLISFSSPFLAERRTLSSDGNFHTLEIASTKFDDSGVYAVQGRSALVMHRSSRSPLLRPRAEVSR